MWEAISLTILRNSKEQKVTVTPGKTLLVGAAGVVITDLSSKRLPGTKFPAASASMFFGPEMFVVWAVRLATRD